MIEIDAYDGGQVYRMRVGEIQTISWRLDGLDVTDALSSSALDPIGAGLSGAQTSIDTEKVAYQFTASTISDYNVNVSLQTSLGEVFRHRLIVEVFA